MIKAGYYTHKTGTLFYAEHVKGEVNVSVTAVNTEYAWPVNPKTFVAFYMRLPWYKQLWYSFLEG